MKIIYLKSTTDIGLIADIAQLVEGYAGEIEFSNGTIHGHWIGKIPDSFNEDGTVAAWKTGYHANLLVPEDFDASILSTLVISPPTNPVHQFA